MTFWNPFRKSPPALSPQEQAAEDLRRDMQQRRAFYRPWAKARVAQLSGERRKRFEAAMNGEVSA